MHVDYKPASLVGVSIVGDETLGLLLLDRVGRCGVGVLVGGVEDLGPIVRDPHVQVEVHVGVLTNVFVLKVLGVHQVDLSLEKKCALIHLGHHFGSYLR